MQLKHMYVVLLLGVTSISFAQTQFSGKVIDDTGEPVIGSTVRVLNSGIGAITDIDGTYVLSEVSTGDEIQASFVGLKPANHTVVAGETSHNFVLTTDTASLEEVIVIGYGTVEKSDATGAVESITEEDFNKGPIISAQQLIQGKSSGVSVSAPTGAPGSGSTVRVRGLSSISNNSDPLYIIDGVPLDRSGVTGSRNPLNFINPQDIQSISILKDASATAIYGSRASAGVIIITTKGGGDKMKFEYNSTFQVSDAFEYTSVLNADQFRTLVNENGTDNQISALGNANTDWQSQIFDPSFGQSQNVSLSGSAINKKLPFRATLGYGNYNGILRTGNFERLSSSINVRPSFFDDALKFNINARFSRENNKFANGGAIGQATVADPTQPVYTNANQSNYNFISDGINQSYINNPVASLLLQDNTGNVNQFVGNIQTNYDLPFAKGLSANLNLALETARGENFNYSDPRLSVAGVEGSGGGFQEKDNKTLETYLMYKKELESPVLSKFDVQGGYSYQEFESGGGGQNLDVNGNIVRQLGGFDIINLQAFFGRANVELFDRFLLTGTMRRDGTSRFTEQNRWGNFPSAAFAYKLGEENFVSNGDFISTLKLRASWGITGNQEVGGAYPSISVYQGSNDQATYTFDDGQYGLLRPNPFNENLKWEENETINFGLDFGFLNERITGSVEVYQRNITDLLNQTNFPAGTLTINRFDANIASMETKGVEFNLSGYALDKQDVSLKLGVNATVQDIEVTKLNAATQEGFVDDTYGNIGFGQNGQGLRVGYTPFSYYVFQQVYDEGGNPVENLFVDLNRDGVINDQDRYINESPFADWLVNFNTEFVYKNFSLNSVFRGSIGNYAMSNIEARLANVNSLFNTSDQPQNIIPAYFNTQFQATNNEILRSDYFVRDASFLKLDNLTAGYNLSNALKMDDLNFSISGSVQNVLTITDYNGIDPEVGIDNEIYPRPRTFLLGVNVTY